MVTMWWYTPMLLEKSSTNNYFVPIVLSATILVIVGIVACFNLRHAAALTIAMLGAAVAMDIALFAAIAIGRRRNITPATGLIVMIVALLGVPFGFVAGLIAAYRFFPEAFLAHVKRSIRLRVGFAAIFAAMAMLALSWGHLLDMLG